MPYITAERRYELANGRKPLTPGELNYEFALLVRSYIAMKNGLSYNTVNDIVGALECQKLELYRKLAANYEDQKERENGSVW